jgi:hypothetical protein
MVFFALATASLFLASCGKSNAEANQNSDGGFFNEQSQGTWKSNPTGSNVYTVTISGSRMTFQRETYFTPECTDKRRTFQHAGNVSIADDYKSGVLNAFIFQPDDAVTLTENNMDDVITLNNYLVQISNETLQQLAVGMPQSQRDQVTRDNQKLSVAKQITQWNVNEPKSLSRLQLEKLETYGLDVQPVAEQNSKVSVHFELDGSTLQLHDLGDFSVVYTKQ